MHLTDKGKDYVENNVARLYAAECEIFASWSEEEIDSYIRFMEKYNELFRAQLEQM